MKMIAAAALVASLSVLQTSALAQNERAQLRLTVVDETNAPLSNATVTVYTMFGARTVNTDEKGVVLIADLPLAATQWWVRTPGHRASADAMRLKPGVNKQSVTLHSATSLTEQSGS